MKKKHRGSLFLVRGDPLIQGQRDGILRGITRVKKKGLGQHGMRVVRQHCV